MKDSQEIRRLTEGTYIQLVCSLFKTIIPTMIMATSFAAVGVHIVRETSDPALLMLLVAGLIAAIARISVLLLYRSETAGRHLDGVRAGQIERRFALPYYCFALIFGLFAARGFGLAPPDGQLLLVGLLFGYGAGVAAGISLRPWISIPSILLAIVPTIAMCFVTRRTGEIEIALLTAVFLAGGIESMLRRYRETSMQIATQRILSSMDRQDDLTGLPNSIALHAEFETVASRGAVTDFVALHCILFAGIDRINALHGHRAGDALLQAASGRLSRCLAPGDFRARLSGLEFAAVQAAIGHPQHAEMLAREIQAALAMPYSIAGKEIHADIAVGYALSIQRDADLDSLMSGAREAALQAKSEPTGVARHNRPRWN